MYLPFLAERQDTVARGDFGKWMLQNIDACFKAAENLGCGINRMEDIILVTGLHRARSWVNVAFSENRVGAQVSFGVRVFGNSGVHFDDKYVNGRGLKLGPSGAVSFCIMLSFSRHADKSTQPEPAGKPNHFRSRIPCRSHPEHVAKALCGMIHSRYG